MNNVDFDHTCGVCEIEDPEGLDIVFWTRDSFLAHETCYKIIETPDQHLINILGIIGRTIPQQKEPHKQVIEKVKQKLEGMTILTYYQKHGRDKLHAIFYDVIANKLNSNFS